MQRSWFAPLVLVGVLSVGRAAGAQVPAEAPSVADRAEARRHFQLGVAAYTRSQWAQALEEFQSAYRLAPHPSVRVNMANCYARLDRPTEAIVHFEQFLAETPSAPEAQTTQVEAQIGQLRGRVGELQITVAPSDAMGLAVTLDGQVISLGRPAHVMPGHHVVEALAEGFVTVHRELDAVAGQPQLISLVLERNAPAPAPIVEPPPVVAVAAPPVVAPPVVPPPGASHFDPHIDAPRRGPPPAVFYAVAGLTGAAAVGWIAAGALALSANSDFDSTVVEIQRGSGNTTALQARGHDEATRAAQLATWSDVAMGVTIAGAVASTVLFLKTDFRARVSVGATASTTGAAITLRGTF